PGPVGTGRRTPQRPSPLPRRAAGCDPVSATTTAPREGDTVALTQCSSALVVDISVGLEGSAVVGPAERFGGPVVVGDERHHLGHQVLHGGELAAPEQPSGQDREEQLYLVQPGGMAGGVVGVEAGGGHEPPAGVAGDVGGAVVQHQVDLQLGRDLGVQVVQEVDEVGRGVAVKVGGGEDPAAVDVQGGQQDRGPVPDILVLLGGRPAGRRRRGGPGAAAGTIP